MKINNTSDIMSTDELLSIEKALNTADIDFSFLKTLMQILPSPIFYKNNLGVYKYCNKAFCEYLGLSMSAIINHTVYDIAPINLANIYQQADLDLIQSMESQEYESQVRYADGTLHDVIFHKTAHVNSHGEAIGLVGIMIDVSSQKKNERQIKKQNVIKDVLIHISHTVNQETDKIDFFKLLLDELLTSIKAADYGTILEITDKENLIILADSGYDHNSCTQFSIPLKESFIWEHSEGVIGQALIIPDLKPFLVPGRPPVIHTLDGRHANSCLYIPIRLNDNKTIIVSIESASVSAFNDIDINIAEYIQLQIPIIHQIYLLNRKTLELSRYDALTGLMNRGYFNTVFEDRLQMTIRQHAKLSLIMFDLDGLKIINDNFGHAAGDRYLEHFSNFIKQQFRSTDMFARIGGDEFLGIFSTTEPLTLKKKMTLLQTLYTEMEIHSDQYKFNGRFSYGIATYPDDADTVDGLLTISDIKMYTDKKNEPNS